MRAAIIEIPGSSDSDRHFSWEWIHMHQISDRYVTEKKCNTLKMPQTVRNP
jgi:hypothetical protein